MRPTFCPQCNEPLSRPGGAAPLRCPVCSTVITPEEALTDAPPSAVAKRRRDEPKRPPVEPPMLVIQPLGRGWRTVYFGLGLVKWGTAAALAALACNVLMVLAAGQRTTTAVRASIPTEDGIGLLAIIVPSAVAALLSLLGRLCCGSAPAESGARLPAVLSFFGTLLAQLLAGFFVYHAVLVELRSASPIWLLPAVLAAGVVSLTAEALFLVLLSQVGRFLQAPEVGRRVLLLVIVAALVVAGVAFGVFLLALGAAPFEPTPASPGSFPPALRAWLAAIFGVALVLLVYLDLINVTRHALARRFARDAATAAK